MRPGSGQHYSPPHARANLGVATLKSYPTERIRNVVLLGHGEEQSRRWFEDKIRTRHPKITVIQPGPGKTVTV